MENDALTAKSELLSRRGFARNTIGAAAVALMPVVEAEGQKSKAAVTNVGEKPADLSDANWGEVQAKYANLLRVYSARLSQDEKGRLLRILTTNQYMLASIRKFVVQNGDPSACTLRV